MQPILFSLGPFNVYSFGFFLCLAFIFSTFVIWKYAKDDFKEEEYLDAYLYFNIFALVFARIIYIISNFKIFGFNLLKYIVVRETPGLNLLGGLIAGFAFLLWFARKKKYKFNHLADIFSVGVSLSLFFAKIGEQLGGAGFGRNTSLPYGVRIAGISGLHFPTEAYEAVCFLLLTVILGVMYKSLSKYKQSQGIIFWTFTLSASLTVFFMEFLKEYQIYLYKFSQKQVLSIVIILLTVKPLISRIINITRVSATG